jgi:hypothetical protein
MGLQSKALPLWDGARPCYRCGHCCKVRSCGFGLWDEVKHQCASLVANPDGTYDCGKFDEIVDGADKTWHFAPAFGVGCCSSMNSDRMEILRRMKK